MNKTGIEYLTHTWNPVAMRCSPVSEACQNCWHLAMCKRHAANPYLTAEVRAAKAGGAPVLLDGELEAPYRLRKPARIGVQFMGDLWHPDIKAEWREEIFRVTATLSSHTFVFLTKRPENVIAFPPHPNMWLGVTVENQKWVDRISKLLERQAAVRFVSLEPLLGEVELLSGLPILGSLGITAANENWGPAYIRDKTARSGLDWLIIGPETGPNRRPCKPEWSKSLIDQADAAGIPVFNKAMNINGRISSNLAEWPSWARRRDWPQTQGDRE